MDYKKLLQKFGELKNANASFIAFPYKTKYNGEVSKRLVNISVSYKNALKKDIEYLKTLTPETELQEQAITELLKSAVLSYRKQLVYEKGKAEKNIRELAEKKNIDENLLKTLQEKVVAIALEINGIDNNYEISAKEKEQHENYSNGQTSAYIHIRTGLKYHTEKRKLYIEGHHVRKTVVEAGEQKEDTRRPLTKEKDKIRKNMKSAKLRTFDIEGNVIGNIAINGDTIEIEATE
jgi:hypothetical protein